MTDGIQSVIPSLMGPGLARPFKRRLSPRKKTLRPEIENCTWRGSDVDKVPQEVLALCAQVRSELSKLEAHSGRRSQLFRATEALAKSGAAKIFKKLKKSGESINDFADRIGWTRQRTMLLVSGEEVPAFWEIPVIAEALQTDVAVLLAAYGYPERTFQSTEALACAVLMEAERK